MREKLTWRQLDENGDVIESLNGSYLIVRGNDELGICFNGRGICTLIISPGCETNCLERAKDIAQNHCDNLEREG